MRPFLLRALLALALLAPLPAQEEDAPTGVTLDPNSGDLTARDQITVSFPTAMVATDQIDAGGKPAAIQFDPPLTGEWRWKSQTEGEFAVKSGIMPGTKYSVALVADLRDLAGAPVVAKLEAGFQTKAFLATCDFEPRKRLLGRPQVRLEFNYPVELSDAAERIYLQDRDTAERFGVEIGMNPNDRNDAEQAEASVLRVLPREPLPSGRTFDLILDGLRSQAGGKPLAYLQRFLLGTTEPLRVEWLGAFNLPRETPEIRAQFTEELVPETVNATSVRVEPAVPKMRVLARKDLVVITGDFDPKQHYKVTLAPTIRDLSGYTLPAESRWGATFQPKPGALFFPGALVHERAQSGLNFSFVQVNTGALTWRLAELPVEKLAEVEKRLREFTEARIDPVSRQALRDSKTGWPLGKETELFIEAFSLAEIAKGDFPASADPNEETLRNLQWAPAAGGKPLAGFYLLEVTGPLRDGDGKRLAGHRSIVCFSDAILTQKRSAESIVLRAARMSDGLPIPNAAVRLVNRNHFLLASGTTDAGGLVTFPAAALAKFDVKERGRLFIAETSAGYAIQPYDTEAFNGDATTAREEQPLRSIVFTDRNLYRPGHLVKMKGLARLADRLGVIREIPAGAQVTWTVKKEYSSESIATGNTVVSAEGGWEAEWAIPNEIKLGNYALSAAVAGRDTKQSTEIKIQEYKAPVFEVNAEPEEMPVPSLKSTLTVTSRYFSGQPNAGAKLRWKASWSRNDYDGDYQFLKTDQASENPRREDDSIVVEGETKLDAEGRATLTCDAPKQLIGTRYGVDWTVWVTSIDGQTIQPNNIKPSTIMLLPAILGVKISEAERGPREKRMVKIEVDAFDRELQGGAQKTKADIEVFHVVTKVAKEKVAAFVFRYRNTPQYVSLARLSAAMPGSVELPLTKTGKYVAVATAPGLKRVSTSEIFGGDGDDDVPVKDDSSLEVKDQRKPFEFEAKFASNDPQAPGAKVPLLIRSPITGQAWVTVESEGLILDSFTVPTNGNNATFDLPVKKEYAPNAFVSVYLVKPGGPKDLPAERFGTVSLTVSRPEWELKITPKFDQTVVQPSELISGSILVESDGHAVADADLTVFAVDDAVLELGEWHAPKVGAIMRPTRRHGVSTYMALSDLVSGINPRSLFEKGFVVGGGGNDDAKFVRKDFKALAFWKTGVRTDAKGRATFQFPAPDNLTRFRLVAVGSTRAHAFGLGSETIEVAKPLIVEPSLPRFLRQGDEVELRAVARLGSPISQAGKVTVRVTPSASLQVLGPAQATAEVTKGNPAAFRFRAKVSEDATAADVKFDATTEGTAGQTDAVEIKLVVHPPVLPRRESVSGTLPAGTAAFAVAEKIPADWRKPGVKGSIDAVVSTSPHLPRLLALPALLDYPHGCFEQISTKALVHLFVGDLLRGLPPGIVVAPTNSKEAVESVLRRYETQLLYSGGLPYWPRESDDRTGIGNAFVSTLAFWVAAEAGGRGYEVPDAVRQNLTNATRKLAHNGGETPFLRAFALFTLAQYKDAPFEAEDAVAVYRERDKLTDEGRALLALALSARKIMPTEMAQLLRELGDITPKERAFDPRTFCSVDRAFALGFTAMEEIRPAQWTKPKRDAALARILKSLEDAPVHSTQENLWTLLAFQSTRLKDAKTEAPLAKLKAPRARAAAPVFSPDTTAALWPARNLVPPASIPLQEIVPANAPLSFLLTAEYTPPPGVAENDRRDRGFRIERVVKNLTDASRDGAKTPYRMNDRLLVTYRIVTPKQRYYVALEDELPAGVENISPDLKMFADTFGVKPDEGGAFLELSNAQRRDQKTQLYFDLLRSGSTSYSILVRVTAQGSFRWPGARITPMYDPRTSGESPAQVVTVGEG